MPDDIPFKDKIKTLQVMSRTGQGSRVVEARTPEGVRTKATREGDPDCGYVTHTEHSKGDRVDALVQPRPVRLGVGSLNGATPKE